MTVLLYLCGVLLFAVGLVVSVALHEVGHLLPAKLFGVKVTQYFVGFGRTLWSSRRGETEYGVKAIPLGGYVKLVGMHPPGPDADPDRVAAASTGMFAQLVSDARAVEYEHVGPEDEGRLFYQQSWWRRMIIIGSGVTINVLIAFVLFGVVFTGYGVHEPGTTVRTVAECVKVVEVGADPGSCAPADPRSPANEAGLRPGDRLISFNGVTITSYEQLQRAIRANDDGAATIVIDRAGERQELHTTTAVNRLPSLEDPEKSVSAGFLGITPTLERHRKDLGFVVTTMAEGTWQTVKVIGTLPVKLYHVGRAALGLEERSVDSPMSVVGVGRVAGEVASDTSTSVGGRLADLVLLLAGFNLFIGLINLVPLPPFDGGTLAATGYETVRRWIARLFGRPDPGVVDIAKLLPVTYVMVLLLIAMTLVLVYADIVAPISLS